MDKPSALHRRKHLSRLLKATPPFVGRSQELDWLDHQVGFGRDYEDMALPSLPFPEVLHTLLDQAPRDLEHLVGNDAKVLRWLMHGYQALADVTNPFTSTQRDQDRVGLNCRWEVQLAGRELP
jgi:hypothetical protein